MRLLAAALGAAIFFAMGLEPASSSDDLALKLDVGPGRFKTGNAIALVLTARLRNPGGQATLNFTTGQRYDFRIDDAGGRTVWKWSTDRAFTQMMGVARLTPEKPELRYEASIAPKLAPGRYRVNGWLTTSPPTPPASADILIE